MKDFLLDLFNQAWLAFEGKGWVDVLGGHQYQRCLIELEETVPCGFTPGERSMRDWLTQWVNADNRAFGAYCKSVMPDPKGGKRT